MSWFNRNKEHDPTDLDAAKQREKQEQERDLLRRLHEAEDFKWIMSDKRGRRFVWGVLERSGLFSLPFDGTGEGAIHTIGITNEARLVMGLIFAHCPEKFTQMIFEREENDDGNASE